MTRMSSAPSVMFAEKCRRRRWSSVTTAQLWREARRRWMVAGVLAAVTLAVLAPRLGAVGGALHAEWSGCVPLLYVYYVWGRRGGVRALWRGVRAHARLHAVCLAHAHFVAPALCAALVTALRDGLDYRLVRGVMLWSRGGGSGWLSLALCSHAAAPSVAALLYLSSLLAAPLATALICGRATPPSLPSIACTLGTTAAPFLAGALRADDSAGDDDAAPVPAPRPSHGRELRLCALALLYVECCERLCDSEGILHVSDVLVTLVLELCAVGAAAATSSLYWRCGVLAPPEARVVALCAVPRALDTRWEASGGCVAAGLVRLPAVFLAPAQALLLAALVPDTSRDSPVVLG
ncbi:uncharacterized protein LOC142983667 [Anticarsia gemmatalis]|uniref:uncharacterized protein LOC142983667 n=1 Tax=Anticarsia gemmatalis TaxID=129554 RepID=UPI003F77421F